MPNQAPGACAPCPKPNCGLSADQYKQIAADRVRYAGSDIYKRNAAITRAYAEMYKSDRETFKWAGMAAFASCEVGKGIRQAEALRESGLPWIPGLTDVSGTELSGALQRGNALVYSDIFWQHLAYQQCGMGDLKKAYDERQITPEVYDAWQKIDQGKAAKNPDLIWEGNQALLRYEQRTVLQDGVYDQDRRMWRKLSSWPFSWGQHIESPIPGDPTSFQDYVDGGDIGSFPDRWKWISESMLPAWKRLDARGADAVDGSLAPCLK